MKKRFLIIILAALCVLLLTLVFINRDKAAIPVEEIPGTMTLYDGYVAIELATVSEIRAKLDERSCKESSAEMVNKSSCIYMEGNIDKLDGQGFEVSGFEVFPRGYGSGQSSFYVAPNKLWASKAIDGPPDPEKYKAAVRVDVKDLIKIEEDSWELTRVEYPWTMVY